MILIVPVGREVSRKTARVFTVLANPIELLAVMLIALLPSAPRPTVAIHVVRLFGATTGTLLIRMEVFASLVPDKVIVVLLVAAGTPDVTTGCAGVPVFRPFALTESVPVRVVAVVCAWATIKLICLILVLSIVIAADETGSRQNRSAALERPVRIQTSLLPLISTISSLTATFGPCKPKVRLGSKLIFWVSTAAVLALSKEIVKPEMSAIPGTL